MKLGRKWMVFVAAAAFAGTALSGMDILKRFGVSAADADSHLLTALTSGSVPVYIAAEAFKEAPAAERVDMIQSAFAWARGRVKAPEFAAAYKTWRDSRLVDLGDLGSGGGGEVVDYGQQMRKTIEEMRKNMAQMSPEMRKEMEKAIADMTAQLKEMEQDEELQAQLKAGAEQALKQKAEEMKKKQADFDRNFPADVGGLVALRLREFLGMAATVDFAAKLLDRSGTKIFANPDYEGKPTEWKLCFRAGREPLQAARDAATAWLSELGKK